MPIVINIVSCCISFVVGFIFGPERLAIAIEEFRKNLQYCKKSPVQIAIDENRKRTESTPFHQDKDPFLPNKLVQDAITNVMRERFGGLFVLGAPSGYGKSTLLHTVVKQLRADPSFDADIVMFETPQYLSVENILTALRAEDGDTLTKILPRYSVIIVDEIYCGELDDTHIEHLVRLATESRNQGSFSVIVAVSSPIAMKQILQANGGQKISYICHPKKFMISTDEESTFNFMQRVFNNTALDAKEIKRMLLNVQGCSFCPATANELKKLFDHQKLSTDTLLEVFVKETTYQQEAWDRYEQIFPK